MNRVGGVLLVLVLATGCGSADAEPEPKPSQPEPTALEQAHRACLPGVRKSVRAGQPLVKDVRAADYLQLGDGGHSLTLQNPPGGNKLSAMFTVPAFMCLLDELKAPAAVRGQVSQTTGLTGRQEAGWGDLSMSWSYNESTGAGVVLTEK